MVESEVDQFGNQCGHSVITAANGDLLEYDLSGIATPPDENFNISFSGDWTITGGTGRFSNATGSGTYQGTANLVAGSGQVSLRGTITF